MLILLNAKTCKHFKYSHVVVLNEFLSENENSEIKKCHKKGFLNRGLRLKAWKRPYQILVAIIRRKKNQRLQNNKLILVSRLFRTSETPGFLLQVSITYWCTHFRKHLDFYCNTEKLEWIIWLIWAVVGQHTDKMTQKCVKNESFCPCSDTLWLKWVKWFTRGFQWSEHCLLTHQHLCCLLIDSHLKWNWHKYIDALLGLHLNAFFLLWFSPFSDDNYFR